MFNENSGLVRTWVDLILRDQYTIEDVPNLLNLRDVISSILEDRR